MTNSPRSTHAAVEKALRILMAFAPHNEKMTPLDLSKKLGLHRSNTNRLLKVLKKHGFVGQDPESRRYYLGRSVLVLSEAVIESLNMDLVSIARPYLDELRDRTKETTALEVWIGDTSILAYISPGPHMVQIRSTVGAMMPVHVAAGARAIMAHLSAEVVDRLLDKKLTRFTPKTITDPEAVKQKLKEIKRKGISIEQGELDQDIHIMAAPVFDYRKRPVAAAVLGCPAYRMKAQMRGKTASLLKEWKIVDRLRALNQVP